jgi:hypothetical protein
MTDSGTNPKSDRWMYTNRKYALNRLKHFRQLMLVIPITAICLRSLFIQAQENGLVFEKQLN